jgi:isopropylmalate/homocitrate/citramalate synthase
MTEAIHIVDVSARDGLQNEKQAASLSARDKVEYIRLLAEAGLKRIEAGSFVKPSAVPSMANSAEVAELLKPMQAEYPDVLFSYLVPNIKGLERAHTIGAREVAVFLATSEQFSKANINQGVEESFAAITPVVKQALQYGMRVRGYLSNMFGYDDLPFSPARVADLSKRLLDMGCYEVSLGDTTGIGTPQQTQLLLDILAAHSLPLARIAMHFHDTFDTAIANVKTSYAFGIRTFDASVGGLGGCPYANSPKGNLAMEDLVAWCAGAGIDCDVTDAALLAKPAAFIKQKLGKI